MGIKIEKIRVKKLGPIQDFSENFGLFNIIYSKNERGKTFLTEFIIRSLFRNIKRWKFREDGVGKVTLSGLDKTKNVGFSPDSEKKLEDYWEKDEKGMPLSMVNLLVSKGGEASIEDTEGGISKNLIKEIFSGFSLLDKIDSDSNISKTVKNADIDEGKIIISNAGEGKTYRKLKDDIGKIDKLFDEIESKYGGGIIESLRSEEKILKKQESRLYRAKCYDAYLISEKIKSLNKKISARNEDSLNELLKNIGIYETKKNEYEYRSSQLKELHQNCKDYKWLQKIRQVYESLVTANIKRPNIIIIILSFILAVAAISFSIFNITIGTITSLVTAIALAGFYIARLLRSLKDKGLYNEFTRIKKEFKNRTGKELSDVAVLDIELEQQKKFYDRANVLSEQIKELDNENNDMGLSIQQGICDLLGRKIPESNWLEALKKEKEGIRDMRSEIETLYNKQSGLGITEIEYLQEDPGITYNHDEYKKIQTNLEEIKEKIDEKVSEIEKLKYSIYSITGDDPSIEWGNLLDNLRIKRNEVQNELDDCASKIIAGIMVHKEVNLLRQEEDDKIKEGLQSDIVLNPLRDITKSYKMLSLAGRQLLISDDYRDFYFKDLSTGIKEQIMLALRIGFSSKILKEDTLFIILDDAFQHSDWERRGMLIKKLKEIALSGWQIIYLSMDDHIKKLFEKEGATGFKKDDFRSIELAQQY